VNDNARRRLWPLALIFLLTITPAAAQAQGSSAPTPPAAADIAKAEEAKKAEAAKAEAAKKAEEAARAKEKAAEAEARKNAALLQGAFRAELLAGGTVNDFRMPQPANRLTDVNVTLTWSGKDRFRLGCPQTEAGAPLTYPAASKAPDRSDATQTVIGIYIPTPPCLWPAAQTAEITVTANIEGTTGVQPIFKGTLPVSGLWFPLLFTVIVVGLIYPGSAAASWYASVRQYKKKEREADPGTEIGEAPRFWSSLDPVELTKNPYGRASIAKLQIFAFTFIVFALLLFHVLRTGLLANMSTDILYLMGISAVGAAGGKMAYVARRRLSLENWAWLRRKGWLPAGKDVQTHAKWSELFVDSNTKEFDPYRFQMAIFSLVVAVALITASATGLEAFKIPPEMLGLLGISQVVFIGGQALEDGGYQELDKKLTEVQKLAKSAQIAAQKAEAARAEAVKAAAPGTTPPKTAAEVEADAEREKYKTALAQAAEMFSGIYGEQLGPDLPAPVLEARNMQVG